MSDKPRELFHRGHYQVLAAILGRALADPENDTYTIWNIVDRMAERLEKDNPKFRAEMFTDAVIEARDKEAIVLQLEKEGKVG